MPGYGWVGLVRPPLTFSRLLSPVQDGKSRSWTEALTAYMLGILGGSRHYYRTLVVDEFLTEFLPSVIAP
jgi:hypothetical protein